VKKAITVHNFLKRSLF